MGAEHEIYRAIALPAILGAVLAAAFFGTCIPFLVVVLIVISIRVAYFIDWAKTVGLSLSLSQP